MEKPVIATYTTLTGMPDVKDIGRNLLRGARLDSTADIIVDTITRYTIHNLDTTKVTVVDGLEGTKALDIESAAGDNTKYIGPWWKAPVESGKTYTVSVYAKGTGTLWIEVVPSDGTNRIGSDGNTETTSTVAHRTKIVNLSSTGTGGAWTRYTLTFEVYGWFKGYVEVNMFNVNSTASSLLLTHPKLEEGDTATAFCVNEDDLRGETGPKGDPGDTGPVGPAAVQYIIECSNRTPNITAGAIDVVLTAYVKTGNETRQQIKMDSDCHWWITSEAQSSSFSNTNNPLTLSVNGDFAIKLIKDKKIVSIDHISPVQNGAKGNSGRVLYPAGTWDSVTTYTRTETAAPYVYHKDKKKYYYLNADTSTNEEPSDTSAIWKAMNQMDNIFAKIGIIDNGTIGSAVFCGDYMYSMTGDSNTVKQDSDTSAIYVTTSEGAIDYQDFDPDHPTGEWADDELIAANVKKTRFAPYAAINFKTGKAYMNILQAKGTISGATLISTSEDGTSKTTIKGGKLETQGAVMNEVTIGHGSINYGTNRQPFVYWDVWNNDTNSNDNLILPVEKTQSLYSFSIPWEYECGGRMITLLNYKIAYNGADHYPLNYSAKIEAPSGFYFYENGITKTSITIGREIVRLFGYGCTIDYNGTAYKKFYGWIVLSREPIGDSLMRGEHQRVIYQGAWNGSTLRYKSFNGATITCAKVSEYKGLYKVTFSKAFSSADDYEVMVSGRYLSSVSDASQVYACVLSKTTTSFEVKTADDSTGNDGGFTFTVIPTDDWQ